MMQTSPAGKAISEFDEKVPVYDAFGKKLHDLLHELLADAGVSFHSVTYRLKNRGSFLKKFSKPGALYAHISDVTDVCGLRIITHFNDDVARVCEILESEFEVDRDNSVNKSALLDPDRFGYLSVHYVLSNSAARSQLKEYRRFNGLKAEIQVRSILQHAWAEIEHDLGYKSRHGVPRELRRRFSRLAGLLELADQEFRTIRDELSSYSGEVLDRIKEEPARVELNAVSFRAFVEESSTVKSLDTFIFSLKKWQAIDQDIDEWAGDVERLNFFGISTVHDLETKLTEHDELIRKFSSAWLLVETEDDEQGPDEKFVSKGISVFYLCYVLALSNSDPNMPLKYSTRFGIGTDPSRLARELAAIFQDIRSTDS